MADPNPPKYLAAIDIVSGSNAIRATDSGGAFDITIDAESYFVSGDDDTDTDLLYQIESELNGNGADTWTVTVSSSGIVSISCDANYEVNWTSGSTTFNGALLGFDTSADTTGSASVATESDYQHQYGFYPAHPIRSDTERAYVSPVTVRESLGYTYNHVTEGASRYVRELEHYGEPSYKTYVDTSYVNQSFYAFWQLIRDGREIRYYPDATVTGTYDSTHPDLSTIERFNPTRFAQGLNIYNWIVRLLEKK